MLRRLPNGIDAAAALTNPAQFPASAAALNDQVLTQLTVERLEGMDEALRQGGRSYSVEEARIADVLADLDEFIASIRAGPETEIDSVLIERLLELRWVLRRFALNGLEGARDAVASMIGAVAMAGMSSSLAIPDGLKERLGRAGRIGKAVMDLAVYGHESALAIQWLGHMAGFLPPPGD
ncbi:MAG: hypothetical protein ACHP84_11005 [Caulobacterales bacterium]